MAGVGFPCQRDFITTIQRFAPPGLLDGNFRICRGTPGPVGAWAGAAPIVKRVPPEEVEGANCEGELKGEDGDAPKAPLLDPNPPTVGRVELMPAGEAG